MRRFGTQGPVNPEQHYVVLRTEELTEFIKRVKEGRYIVIFAPRQTGKTTFFYTAMDILAAEEPTYIPIHLDFEAYKNLTPADFYSNLAEDIREDIENLYHKRGAVPSEALRDFLENINLTDNVSMLRAFRTLARVLENQRVVVFIDEFDGIPPAIVSDFLYALRRIYISRTTPRCPHSLGIIGVKSIAQLDYDRSVSPFNIHDDFAVPNFTLAQVQELFGQYTDAVGQVFASEVIESIHKQTGGQPFLVNRFAQILTEEMDIPKTETLTMDHFSEALIQILDERNTNLTHLTTNIRRNPRTESFLMRIMLHDEGVPFNLRSELINELATYGVLARGTDRMCKIANPIYLHCILQAFKPIVNGLERDYFPENTDGSQYLTFDEQIQMEQLMDNFRDFIARAGFRILQVPETPQEFIGQHLLFAYLDQFVSSVNGTMYMEVPTGRGRMDLIILHNEKKYIVETKIWRSERSYAQGKQQLAAYLSTEDVAEGYYIVFDYREAPEPRTETETINGLMIRSDVIPVVQERPSRDNAR